MPSLPVKFVLNQISVISATMKVIATARLKSLIIIASLRSGETKDDWLHNFSVGIDAEFFKYKSA